MPKLPQKWASPNADTTATNGNAGIVRVEQNAVVRKLENGIIRVIEDTKTTPKKPIAWQDS